MGVDFQEELSDMLLLKMLQAATRASSDKDKVRFIFELKNRIK